MVRCHAILALLLGLLGTQARADEPRELLEAALAQWSADVDRWSFVQHVREYHGTTPGEVRAERFDPSQPDNRRWELLSVNNRPPTIEERRAFDARKNAKPRKRILAPGRYIDYERIRVVRGDARTVTLEVRLRGDVSVLVPFEDIGARVEIDRESATIRRLEVGLLREMRIAFGLARVTRLDVAFMLDRPASNPDAKTLRQVAHEGPPSGSASATLSRFGRRIEISWSDFARVGS